MKPMTLGLLLLEYGRLLKSEFFFLTQILTDCLCCVKHRQKSKCLAETCLRRHSENTENE